MRRITILGSLVLVLLATAFSARARVIEPAYVGPYGNPEETALRPYKWMWRGLGAFFYQVADKFRDGNAHTPILGTVQTLRGVRMGTFELLESTYRGVVFAPAPPRGDYMKIRQANTRVAGDANLEGLSDFTFSWFLYPAIRLVDEHPAYTDEEVEARREQAELTRQQREAAEAPKDGLKAWERAQRRYIGDRATYGEKKSN